MSFTESKIIKQITILPESGAINVQWANQVLKNGTEVISETFERKAYAAELSGFSTEVGALDVNAFLAAFDTATLDAKVDALAAKATAEAALTAKQAEMDTALATAQADHAAELAAVQAGMDAERTALQAALAAKDAEIAALQVQVVALIPAPVIVDGVPQTVTMRQARLALLASGLLNDVTAAVAGAGQAAQIEWEYASDVGRNAALIQSLAGVMGLTDEQLDGLFVLAATL